MCGSCTTWILSLEHRARRTVAYRATLTLEPRSMNRLDDVLFMLALLEASVCLACAYMVVLVASHDVHHHRVLVHLGMFGVAVLALLLTAAFADGVHALRDRPRARR